MTASLQSRVASPVTSSELCHQDTLGNGEADRERVLELCAPSRSAKEGWVAALAAVSRRVALSQHPRRRIAGLGGAQNDGECGSVYNGLLLPGDASEERRKALAAQLLEKQGTHEEGKGGACCCAVS